MRPIKFRAWNKQERKMLQWGSGVIAIDHQLNVETVPYGKLLKHSDIELMQYTGLHDKNGREIYEGDILEIENATAKVVFWERPPAFGLAPIDENEWCDDWNITDDSDRMSIVGNIYETPEQGV